MINILNNCLIFKIKSQKSFKCLNETHKTKKSFLSLQANFFSTLRLIGCFPYKKKGAPHAPHGAESFLYISKEPAHSQKFSKLDLKISQKFVALRSTHNHSVNSVNSVNSVVWPRNPENIRDQDSINRGVQSSLPLRKGRSQKNKGSFSLFKPNHKEYSKGEGASNSKYLTDWKGNKPERNSAPQEQDQESWSKRKNLFKNLSHYKLENSDLTLLKNANEIRKLINSKYFFDIFLSKAINVKYNFNKYTQNSEKIDLNSLYKILKYSFASLSALISKPVYIYTSDKIYIQFFYFITPNWNKLKKQRKEKYLIKKTGWLAGAAQRSGAGAAKVTVTEDSEKNHQIIFLAPRKIMTKFKIKNFLAHWKESNDFIRLPYLSEKFFNLALQMLDLPVPTEGKAHRRLGTLQPLIDEEKNSEGFRHHSALKESLEDKSKHVFNISAEAIHNFNNSYSDLNSNSGSPTNIFSPIVSTKMLDSYISKEHILYNLKNGQLSKVDILKFRTNQVLQLILSDINQNSVYSQTATASKILDSKTNTFCAERENLSGCGAGALEQDITNKEYDGGNLNLKNLNAQSMLTSPLYNKDWISDIDKILCETGSATIIDSGYVAPAKLLDVALKDTVPESVPVSVPVSVGPAPVSEPEPEPEPVKELSQILKDEELAMPAEPEQKSDLLSIMKKYKIGSFAMLEKLAEQDIFLSPGYAAPTAPAENSKGAVMVRVMEPATNQFFSLQLLKFKQTNTLISLNEKIFHKLISNLEKFFGKEVELIVKRIKYPYHDSNILSQLLKNNSNKTIFRKMIKKLFFTASASVKKKKATPPTKLLLKKKPQISIIPSFLSGIKVKLAGRINTQRVIPRFTVQSFQMGSLARGKVNYIETSRITHKGKRGAFTFTVTTGHIFNTQR